MSYIPQGQRCFIDNIYNGWALWFQDIWLIRRRVSTWFTDWLQGLRLNLKCRICSSVNNSPRSSQSANPNRPSRYHAKYTRTQRCRLQLYSTVHTGSPACDFSARRWKVPRLRSVDFVGRWYRAGTTWRLEADNRWPREWYISMLYRSRSGSRRSGCDAIYVTCTGRTHLRIQLYTSARYSKGWINLKHGRWTCKATW